MNSKKDGSIGKRRPKTHFIENKEEQNITPVSKDFKRRTRIDDSEAGIPNDLFSMIFSKDFKDIKKMSQYVDDFNKSNSSMS